MIKNRSLERTLGFVATSALCLFGAPYLSAQTAAPAGAEIDAADDQPIILSPFVVEAGEDQGYQAKNTLAGTRIRTDLKDVGTAIQVVTQKFLQDTGSRNSADLLVYTTNTEVGGQGGNFANLGNQAALNPKPAQVAPQTNTRVRGLDQADNTRDYFLTDIPWDGYNVGRVDIQRGANSVLFGIGSPAGIVNSSVNGAAFRNENTAEFRFGSYGSSRLSLDFNRVLLKNELAVRFSYLNDETFFRQKPGFNHDRRYFGALRYEPGFLNRGSAHTTIKVNFEKGNVNANRPDPTPPIDNISPWFDATYNGVRQWTYNAQTVNSTNAAVLAADPTAGGLNPANTDRYNPWINGGPGGALFDGIAGAFWSERSGTVSDYFMGSLRIIGLPTTVNATTGRGVNGWNVMRGIQDYQSYATGANLPANSLGVYKARTLADSSIFDFYNHMIQGPNKSEVQEFDAVDAVVTQTFFNNKLGVEGAFDSQNYYQEQTTLFGDQTPRLTVDIMSTLPDGRPNPNVGRPMVVTRSNSNGSRQTDRDSYRITGFGELDFKDYMDRDSWVTKMLGRHVLTGLYSEQEIKTKVLGWQGQIIAPGFADEAMITVSDRGPATMHYLGESLLGKQLTGSHIPGVTAKQVLTTGRALYFDSTFLTENPVNLDDLAGWRYRPLQIMDANSNMNDRALMQNTNPVKQKDTIKSKVLVYQPYLFDDIFVPMISWRKDVARTWSAPTPPYLTLGGQSNWQSYDLNSTTWVYPDEPSATVEGSTKSYGFVLHTPKRIRSKLPWGTNISLTYNRSDNFRPDSSSIDLLGHALPSPSGKTKDYGFTITTLNDKLTLRVNWYDSAVKNARLTGDPGNVYSVGYAEGWAYMFAQWARLGVEGFSTNYALSDTNNPNSPLIDPNVTVLHYQPEIGETVAQAKAVQDAAVAAVLDPANLPPQDFIDTWNISPTSYDPTRGWGNQVNTRTPNGLQLTGDTRSKGVEYELQAQPTPEWSIMVNVSKTDAQRQNMAESFATWIESRYALYSDTAYGDVRFWNGGNDQQNLLQWYNGQIYGPYTLYRLQEGSNVPELRPWHVNIVTNYAFRDGLFKDINVGGAWRWADGIVTGYPIIATEQFPDGTFDLANPYKGPSEKALDLWIGYERKLTSKIHWRIQLNARNVLAKKELIPITVQPDGSPGASRIATPMTVYLTNTFKF